MGFVFRRVSSGRSDHLAVRWFARQILFANGKVGGNLADDDALVLLAELLLNIGLPVCDIKSDEGSTPADKSYVLECSLGHSKVAKWSAEAQFHLPHSFSWPGKYQSLDV